MAWRKGAKLSPGGVRVILYLGRHLAVDLAVEKAVLLQLPQLLGEGGVRDPLQPAEKLSKPLHPVGGYIP